MPLALEGKLLISILAGVKISQLTGWVSPTTTVVRAMPNTPCRVRVFPVHSLAIQPEDPP
jgi:pyrroline-5-carboxylate reductase